MSNNLHTSVLLVIVGIVYTTASAKLIARTIMITDVFVNMFLQFLLRRLHVLVDILTSININ